MKTHSLARALLLCLSMLLPIDYAHAASGDQVKPPVAYILTLADIHFDPFVSCQGRHPCPLITRLRNAPASAWGAILSREDHSTPDYRQDSDYVLFASSLAAAKKVAQQQPPRFVLILGDFLGHDFRRYYKKYSGDTSFAGYQAFTYKTLTFMNDAIARAFPNVDVYAVVGNNDSYSGDYVTATKGRFFSDMAVQWSSLIKNPANREAMRKQFETAGYYALTLPELPHLRLIVMNTVMFSYKAAGKKVEEAANDQLNWLHAQLQQAKENHQKVLIAMHIPESIDAYASSRLRLFTLMQLWQGNYKARFQMELQQYASDIMAVFSGHLHTDWMRVITQNSADIPVSGTPSVSPIFGNNPGFKLYLLEPDTLKITNFITYYFPVGRKRTWGSEYFSNQLYKSSCSSCSVQGDDEAVYPSSMLSHYYRLFFSASITQSQTPLPEKWYPYYECAIEGAGSVPHDQSCGLTREAP